MSNLLNDFIFEPENYQKNYDLGLEYYKIGQTASAICFFLRCADRCKDEDIDLAYECLIHIGDCFFKQGNRLEHVRCMYKQAISTLPKRPEAYYKLAHFENTNGQYQNAYFLCSQAFELCDFESKEFIHNSEYTGTHCLLFEKTRASWYWGKVTESKDGLIKLYDDHWGELTEFQKDVVKKHLIEYHKVDIGSVIDNFYANPNSIEWGNLTKDPETKDYIATELISGIYSKFFDVEEGDVVFDIGASVGLFPLTVLNKNPKEIHCFEPNKVLFDAMTKNLKSFDNLHLNNIGIGGKKGDEVFLETTYAYDDDSEKFVSTTTFMDYVKSKGIEKIDFLKTDCEGGEWDIFTKENYSWIKNNVRKVTGEFHIHKNPLFRKKFIEFRDLYLKNAKNVVVFYSNKNADIYKIDVWDDESVEKISYCNVSFELSTEISHFEFSKTYKSTTWIVDNFYEDPDSVRKFALDQDYHIGGIGRGYIGNRTLQQFLFPGLKERFEEVMGRKITGWQEYDMNGRFQYCWAGQPRVWHMDNQMWGGMIYLSPDAPFECGTSLFAHKKTRARSRDDEGWGVSWTGPGDPHLDGTPFEPVDVLGNVYNRLVIFDASCIHSASEYFGTVKENCRLWQMFFFDTKS